MKRAISIVLLFLFLVGSSLCLLGCIGELLNNPLKWN